MTTKAEKIKTVAEFMNKEIATTSQIVTIIENGKLSVYNPLIDWNQLMEVVEKIESENFKNEAKDCVSFLVKIVNNNCQILDLFKDRFEINIYAKTKIEAVCNACVEFIKWNNEQKSA